MIDYIGQLLEQQLEREERDGTWEAGPVRVPLPAVGEEEAGQSGENIEEADLSALEGKDGVGLALTEGHSGTVTGADIRRWMVGLDVLDQAGERRTYSGPETDQTWTEAARELDQAVRISLEGLPAAERQTQVVTLEPPGREQNGGQDGLRRLDRLVRRDARRFDGGFQLL